jgi:hypothetical protein
VVVLLLKCLKEKSFLELQFLIIQFQNKYYYYFNVVKYFMYPVFNFKTLIKLSIS